MFCVLKANDFQAFRIFLNSFLTCQDMFELASAIISE